MATNSKDYWKTREEENLRRCIREEAKYIRELKRTYTHMQRQIQNEIDSFLMRYADKEGISIAEARKRAGRLDMEAYAEKAKRYVREKDFSDLANAEMRLYNLTMKINRLELLKAQIGLELAAGFNEIEKQQEQILNKRAQDELARQAGILGTTLANNAKMANAIVNASFKNAKFSDRIWMHQEMLKAEIDKLLQIGLIQGRNPRELARQLRKAFDVSRYNSERLMHTELARVQTEAQKQSYIDNGYDRYQFHALGLKACEICRDIDGKDFPIEKMMPGDNAPPMHPNCRCSTSAYMDDKAYNEWLDGYKEHGLNFAEWKNGRKLGGNNNSNGSAKSPKPTRVGKLDDMSEGNIRKTLAEWEEKIIDQAFETAIIITKNGDIYRCDGDKNSVNINGLSDENLSGAWMTHNHPLKETYYSFSSFDISEALRHRFSLLRGVDEVYTYEYRTTKNTINAGFDEIYNLFGEKYRNKAYEANLKGEIDIDFDEYDYICRQLAKDYNFEYERKRK